jgi:hypothetical protein
MIGFMGDIQTRPLHHAAPIIGLNRDHGFLDEISDVYRNPWYHYVSFLMKVCAECLPWRESLCVDSVHNAHTS